MNHLAAQTCGTGSFYQLDTIHWAGLGQTVPPVRIFDNTGKEYMPSQLTVNPLLPFCDVGKFHLEFEDLAAVPPFFQDNTIYPNTGLSLGEMRRNLVCHVFRDLSNFLADVAPINISARVNILIRGHSNAIATNPVLGTAVPFFIIPANLPSGLILDTEVQKTILSGQNSYNQYPLGAVNNQSLYHGIININAEDIFAINAPQDWHCFENLPNTMNLFDDAIGQADLYTVTLHEAIHLLGCIWTNVPGPNISGSIVPNFSRYHKFLQYSNQTQVLSDIGGGNWIENPNPFTDTTCGSSGSTYFNGFALQNQETMDNGTNRHHLRCEDITSPLAYSTSADSGHIPNFLVMSGGGFGPDFAKRHPAEEEKNLLCDLGYSFEPYTNGLPEWGTADPNNNFTRHSYTTPCSPPCNVVSISDILTFTGTIPTAINIQPLSNDLNVNVGTTISQVRILTPNAGAFTLNGSSTEINFTPSSAAPCNGWVVLSYVPVCPNGNDGGTSYIFIYLGNEVSVTQNILTNVYLPNDIVQCTVEVCNNSLDVDINNPLTIDITLPAELTYISGQSFPTTISSLAAGDCIQFVYEAQVTAYPTCNPLTNIQLCAEIVNPSGVCTTSAYQDCDNITINPAIPEQLSAQVPPNSGNTLWSDVENYISNLPNGTTLQINGNLIIDIPAALGSTTQHLEIIMATDAASGQRGKITVTPKQSLIITNTHFYACDEMWEGIELTPGTPSNHTSIEVDLLYGSTASQIEDALIAINAEENSNVQAFHTHFNKNGTGIQILLTNTTAQTSILRVEDCTFDCTGNTLSDVEPGKQWSKAGIIISGMLFQTGVNAAFTNVFRNMPFGIWGENSIMMIKSCSFQNINTDHVWYVSNSPTSVDGTAIICNGISPTGNGLFTGGYLDQQGFGLTGQPTFSNCRRAIFGGSSGLSLYSSNNKMVNMRRGIEISGAGGSVIKIFDNEIYCREYGITYRFGPKGKVDIDHNYIELDNNNISAFNGIFMGIWINNANTPAQVSIRRNMLKIHEHGQYGIRIQDVLGNSKIPHADGVTIENNGIRMTFDAFHNRRAIYATNSPYLKIINNNDLSGLPSPSISFPLGTPAISGAGWNTSPSSTALGQVAMHIENCDNSLIECNTMTNTQVGVRFRNNCNGTDLKGNEFNLHSYGFYIALSSVIGPQNWQGNKWNWAGSATNGYVTGALNDNGFGSDFLVKDPTSAGVLTIGVYPFIPIKNNAFSFLPATLFQNIHSNLNFECQSGGIPIVARLTHTDTLIANDSLVSEIYPEETLWSAQRELYDFLTQNDSLLPDSGAIRTFYDSKSQTNFSDFQAIASNTQNIYDWGITESVLTSKQLQIHDMMQVLSFNDSLILSATLDSVQIGNLLQSNHLLQDSIASLSSYCQILRDNMLLQQSLEADSVNSENTLLSITEQYEQNEKDVNEIFLATFAKNILAFDSSQTAILESIANQCPLSGGAAVYIARSMLSVIYELVDYNDDSLCLEVGMVWRMQQKPQETSLSNPQYIKAYPNPVNGTLHFELYEPLQQESRLEIFDSFGRVVGTIKMDTNKTHYEWDTESLSEGVYFYSINQHKGKVIVIK